MVNKLIRHVGFALGVLAVAASPIASAQQWPTKPVTFVSPFPPGGSVDPLARLFAAKLSEALGQQFIVENRTGASGSIGTGYVAKAPADGYTFVFVFDTHATNPYLLPKMTYDTIKDLTPVMLVGTAPMAFATSPSKPYKTFTDYVNAAKAKPDTLSYGSVGSGSLGHLAMTLLQKDGSFKVVHVPYKGGGPMSIDIMGSQIDGGIGSIAVLGNHIRSGKMRALAVTSETRAPSLPDVPTMAEQGFKGFSAEAWWAVYAPAGTPKAIIDKLNAEMVKITKQPDVYKQLTETQGMNLKASTPEALAAFTQSEMDRWSKVIKENNIKPD
ncbi:tripartite tricarboxylate transporter substrate binding protein [Zwartia panacis]|uniref:tripartite tricarboxylate transporter substrate binding protein n=1 Tax=Zwartia panacis TaxID=2683345 RepID=UPI0025B4EC99|nr:tripartite tricarboxylate transporter substrate binding protein [Zwartia panacis]MDN4017780.1 tripartite tricarboxylate transporter substrate binding protein [Zwartia panacis]